MTVMAAKVPAVHDERLQSLVRLLRWFGHDANARMLYELCGGRFTSESLISLLSGFGKSARAVHAEAHDIRGLELPALMFLRDDSACVVSRITRKHAHVQHAGDRVQRMPLEALLRLSTGEAIEVLETPQVRFFSALSKRMHSVFPELVKLAGVALVMVCLGLATPYLSRLALDEAVPTRAHSLLLVVALGAVVVAIQRAWLAILREHAIQHVDARLQTLLLRGLFERALNVTFETARLHRVGEVLQGLGSAEAVANLVTRVGVIWLFDAVVALAYVVALGLALPWAALTVLACGFFTIAGTLYGSRRQAHLQGEELEASAAQRNRLLELVGGVSLLRAAGAERYGVQRWLDRLLKERALVYRRERMAAGLSVWLQVWQQISLIAVFAWGGQQALEGALSVGELLYATLLADLFGQSIGRLAGGLPSVWASIPHAANIDNMTMGPGRVARLPYALTTVPQVAVAVSDLWFRYAPDDPWVLAGNTFEANFGETVVLRSASGTGKTTLLRLIAGLCEPERGTVRVLGRTPQEMRDKIAYLPQNAYLFEGSIEENLRLLSGASRERILGAALATGLSEWLETLPMGFDTVLPPGGRNLSGGQRQWIVITAAVASERPILLMDEAFSQLDGLARKRVLESGAFEGKTLIVVSHE